MPKCTLRVSEVGQLEEAEVRFGDLTVLVGPQATGKSIFLELFKFMTDTGAVLAELRRYGLDWSKDGHKDVGRFLGVYLGEGMQGIWREGRSAMAFNGRGVDLKRLVSRQRPRREESTFFIPAQRVLTLARGWPRPFTDYGPGDPFAVRDFSEKIRRLMESGIGVGVKGVSAAPCPASTGARSVSGVAKAGHGEYGQASAGKGGSRVLLRSPVGSNPRDLESRSRLRRSGRSGLGRPGRVQRTRIRRGGRGGRRLDAMRGPMSFKNAVRMIPGLEDAYRRGLQALRRTDRKRIRGLSTGGAWAGWSSWSS